MSEGVSGVELSEIKSKSPETEVKSEEVGHSKLDNLVNAIANSRVVRLMSSDKTAEFVLARKEWLGFGFVTGIDIARDIITKDPKAVLSKSFLEATPDYPANITELASHGGGLFDAYFGSMLTYYGISLLTYPVREKVPEIIKVAIASMVGLAVVVANELGVWEGGFSEPPDIPSGAIGALMFSGIMLLNKQFIKDTSIAIKRLRRKIKKEKRP